MQEIFTIIPPWQMLVYAAIFGALWGSFANVVIVRWPLEMSVVRPASHCFSCKKEIRFYDNIPILSYLVLRGKCRHCGASFSPRYMLVELCMALLSVGVANITLLAEQSTPQQAMAEYFIWFAFVWALVTIAMIDLETYLIPDVITLPGIVLGIAANAFILPLGWMEPLITAVAGYALIRLMFIDGYKLLTGAPGMGEGDAKLLAMFGAFLGVEGTLFALFAGAFQGLIIGVVMVLIRRKDGEQNEPIFEDENSTDGENFTKPDARFRKAKIPFGPFLALGAMEYYFAGHAFLTAYLNLISQLVGI